MRFVRAQQSAGLEVNLACHVRFLYVPNRSRNVRQFYLSYAFPESAKKSARLKDNPTRHVRFLCLLIRVSDLKSILLDMCVSYECRIERET